jgi:Na+/melibiose symporter-like transporter
MSSSLGSARQVGSGASERGQDSTGSPIRPAALLAYGALGLPLAFAALPVYVHVPKLYADTLGMSLAVVGFVLLAARLSDAVVDPLLGWWSDRVGRRRLLILVSLPTLAFGMLGLLSPPPEAAGAGWLTLFLTLVYFSFSLASVNYQSWGAEVSPLPHERTRIVASREGFALVGVIAASVAPALLGSDLQSGLARLALLFLPLLALASVITLLGSPADAKVERASQGAFAALRMTLEHARFRWLLAIFAANGIAVSIPATLVLFFVADVLQLEGHSGLFLATYFISGVAALPLWVALARRWGKTWSWLLSMALAVAVFIWAFFLGSGDLVAFCIICALSGAALGADLALPPSMLADVIDRDTRAAADAKSGGYFGLWNLVTKLNLALAAGITLPLLAWFGYRPGSGEALVALSAAYALLPVVLKLGAAWLLFRLRGMLN